MLTRWGCGSLLNTSKAGWVVYRCEPAKGLPCTTLARWSLHRFQAKAIWSQTALLPSVRPRWSTIDDNRKCATLTSHGVTVSLELRFNAADEVVGIFKSVRWGSFGDR